MSYRKERFRLRFRGLSEEERGGIRSALPEAETKQRGNILMLEMGQEMDLERLYTALETLQLGPKQFEVIASVVTSSENGGIELPGYVLDLIRRTRCGVGFSFVNTGPGEVEDDHETQPAAWQ
ncbi:MAG TPA: hypothetical protein VK335_13105 [Bryobacteraceae bacterium]|nr:hypothetical protein [Bryobacteraceae bacterium]